MSLKLLSPDARFFFTQNAPNSISAVGPAHTQFGKFTTLPRLLAGFGEREGNEKGSERRKERGRYRRQGGTRGKSRGRGAGRERKMRRGQVRGGPICCTKLRQS